MPYISRSRRVWAVLWHSSWSPIRMQPTSGFGDSCGAIRWCGQVLAYVIRYLYAVYRAVAYIRGRDDLRQRLQRRGLSDDLVGSDRAPDVDYAGGATNEVEEVG